MHTVEFMQFLYLPQRLFVGADGMGNTIHMHVNEDCMVYEA